MLFPYLWEPGYIPRDPQPIFFHDPARGDERIVDVGMGGVDFAGHRRQPRGRAARRGPAAGLRRTDARAAPGRRVVGRVVGQPQLRARDGCCSAAGPTGRCRRTAARRPSDAAATARFEELAAQAPGLHQRRARRAGDARSLVGRAAIARQSSSPRGSTGDWTGAGGARPTATSPPVRTRRGWRASRRSTSSPTRTTAAGRRRSWRTATTRPGCAEVPSLLADMPSGVARRHVRARRPGGDGLRRRGPRRGAGAADRRGPGATGGGRRRARAMVVAGLGAVIDDTARPAARGRAAARRPARGPPRRAGLRAAARGRRRTDGQRRARGDRRGAARRPGARRLRRAPRGSGAAQPLPRLPHRERRPRGPPRRPLRRRRLQDQLARRRPGSR